MPRSAAHATRLRKLKIMEGPQPLEAAAAPAAALPHEGAAAAPAAAKGASASEGVLPAELP